MERKQFNSQYIFRVINISFMSKIFSQLSQSLYWIVSHYFSSHCFSYPKLKFTSGKLNLKTSPQKIFDSNLIYHPTFFTHHDNNVLRRYFTNIVPCNIHFGESPLILQAYPFGKEICIFRNRISFRNLSVLFFYIYSRRLLGFF